MSLRKWWQNLELRVEGDLGEGLLLPAPQSPHLHKRECFTTSDILGFSEKLGRRIFLIFGTN